MKVVITGGTGFVGRRLARALAARGELAGPGGSRQSIDEIVLFDAVAPEGPVPEAPDAAVVKGDLADPASVAGAIDRPDIAVFHLGAMVSGGCEEDFDGAWQVNVEGTRNVLEAARAVGSAPRLVFTSTMGAFGGDYVREPVGDFTKQSPQTTYGVSKSIGELLVNDYARKGFVDARAARLATVIVRAGKPNMALSSYASAVIREPLAGIDYVCPVAAETSMPMIGYETCVGCLIRMAELDGDEIGPRSHRQRAGPLGERDGHAGSPAPGGGRPIAGQGHDRRGPAGRQGHVGLAAGHGQPPVRAARPSQGPQRGRDHPDVHPGLRRRLSRAGRHAGAW